jgi:REP element-mobilizing transposase RayT
MGGATYFVTFRVRQGVLAAKERKLVLDACLQWNAKKWQVYAVTVMPDHVHVLAKPLEKEPAKWFSLAEILHSVKRHSAREIGKQRGKGGRLWNPESFDRIVRDEAEFREKLGYIANNAVKRGLADEPEGYAYFWWEGVQEGRGAPCGRTG